jgi:hypothetical protein
VTRSSCLDVAAHRYRLVNLSEIAARYEVSTSGPSPGVRRYFRVCSALCWFLLASEQGAQNCRQDFALITLDVPIESLGQSRQRLC